MWIFVAVLLVGAGAVCAGVILFACVLSGRIEREQLPPAPDAQSGAITIDARLGEECIGLRDRLVRISEKQAASQSASRAPQPQWRYN